MKKKYESAELEIIRLVLSDVITTSSGQGTTDDDQNDPFKGSYDVGGWT